MKILITGISGQDGIFPFNQKTYTFSILEYQDQ